MGPREVIPAEVPEEVEAEVTAALHKMVKDKRQYDAFNAGSPWRPIETAPKRKQDVLLFADGDFVIGWWNTRTLRWCHQDLYLSIEPPTHWMPLPPPPEKA